MSLLIAYFRALRFELSLGNRREVKLCSPSPAGRDASKLNSLCRSNAVVGRVRTRFILRIMIRSGAFRFTKTIVYLKCSSSNPCKAGLAGSPFCGSGKHSRSHLRNLNLARVAKFGPKKSRNYSITQASSGIEPNWKLRSQTPAQLCAFRRSMGVWILFCGELWAVNHW